MQGIGVQELCFREQRRGSEDGIGRLRIRDLCGKVIGHWIWGQDREELSQLESSAPGRSSGLPVTSRGWTTPKLDQRLEQINLQPFALSQSCMACSIICHELNSTCPAGDRERYSEWPLMSTCRPTHEPQRQVSMALGAGSPSGDSS